MGNDDTIVKSSFVINVVADVTLKSVIFLVDEFFFF